MGNHLEMSVLGTDAAATWNFERPDELVIGRGRETQIIRRTDNERGAIVKTGGNKRMDMIFALFRHRHDLRRLRSLVGRLKPAGVLWTLRPKGSPELKEAEMMQAGKDAGLVDVKVVSFSDELTAEKFVIPVADRANATHQVP